MLQPTSCGPGPPDKTFEFNCNELQDNMNDANDGNNNYKETREARASRGGASAACFAPTTAHDEGEEGSGAKDGNGKGDNDEYGHRVKGFMRNMMTGTMSRKNNNNDNNNNNCHLKNMKFYLNNITAASTASSVSLLTTSTPSSEATIVAAEATSTAAAAAAASAIPCCVMWQPILNWLQRGRSTVCAANVANFKETWFGTNFSSTISAKWILMFLMLFSILAQTPHQVAAEKSKHYYMQSLCKNHFLQQLYRKIDGAVLWSQNERNLDCIITFQTHSILQRFMLRFDMLQLDCNDHLYVYDGAHAVATPKIDISCRQTKQTVSSMLTRTNFVTLKYVTDNWGTDANGFKLVITSVKDPKHTCKDFTCGSNGFCIHPDLLCDGINHCSDNSDESVHNLCQSETTSTVFGMDMTWFVMIVIGILLILSAAIVGITICVCRRQEETNNQHQTAMQLHHTAETNGSSKHLHYTHHGGTLTREHTQLPPTSGNWHHPAGPYGYHRTQRNYLKMATKVRPIWCLANFVN